LFLAVLLFVSHAPLLRLPYFWDEAGYYIPAARDLLAGSLIPHSTPSNAHPPLVMAWLALSWKIFGESQFATRCAMLLLAAFSLAGFYRLAKTVSNPTVAAASTFLTAAYPVFFAQSSLAHVDLPAAGMTFWALAAFFRRQGIQSVVWFSLAALAKETAILVPLALVIWKLVERTSAAQPYLKIDDVDTAENRAPTDRDGVSLLLVLSPVVAVVPLAAWYAYHYLRTGFVFGNPEFLRYNLQGNFHPVRIILALLLRIWQSVCYLSLYILTLACLIAMKYPALPGSSRGQRPTPNAQRHDETRFKPRISLPIQFTFLAIAIMYVLALSILGGAPLARYMLPIVPLFILICVSTIWRRLRAWKAVLAVAAAGFVCALFINPPYGFAPEDNLAYREYIRLHKAAEAFVQSKYPHARVLTAWPASDELSRPNLGYISRPMQVVRIDDFTAEQLFAASDARSQFDVALVFSTKVQPAHTFFDKWRLWQEWKTRYFGYHVDLTPEAAASVLGGNLVYLERRKGQWVGVIEMEKVEEARATINLDTSAGR
jgi:hypothetical protein